MDIINSRMMLSEAMIPNSFNRELFAVIKVPKPAAVVKLVYKVAFPIFVITRDKDLARLP